MVALFKCLNLEHACTFIATLREVSVLKYTYLVILNCTKITKILSNICTFFFFAVPVLQACKLWG